MSHQARDRDPDGNLNIPACDLSEKRGRTMSRKALESAAEIKRHKADNSEKKLWRVMRSVEALDPASCTKNVFRELVTATEEFGLILKELDNLREQDKFGVFGSQAAPMSENLSLKNANNLVKELSVLSRNITQ